LDYVGKRISGATKSKRVVLAKLYGSPGEPTGFGNGELAADIPWTIGLSETVTMRG
jgi:hypothetical protein